MVLAVPTGPSLAGKLFPTTSRPARLLPIAYSCRTNGSFPCMSCSESTGVAATLGILKTAMSTAGSDAPSAGISLRPWVSSAPADLLSQLSYICHHFLCEKSHPINPRYVMLHSTAAFLLSKNNQSDRIRIREQILAL